MAAGLSEVSQVEHAISILRGLILVRVHGDRVDVFQVLNPIYSDIFTDLNLHRTRVSPKPIIVIEIALQD